MPAAAADPDQASSETPEPPGPQAQRTSSLAPLVPLGGVDDEAKRRDLVRMKLVATGFLVAAEERRGARGAREVPYLATGKSWLMEIDQPSPRDHLLAAFLEEVAAVGEDHLDSSRLGLRLSDQEYEDFRVRLAEFLNEYARRPLTPGGRRWSLYVGVHPEEV